VSDGSTGEGVADSYIYIPATKGGRQANLVETFTDELGAFEIEGVPLEEELQLHVEAPEGSDAVGAAFPIVIPAYAGSLVQFASLVPGALAGGITGISIAPSAAQRLRRADALLFTAQVSGAPGVRPTWWTVGGIGWISPTGLFVATRAGRGAVVAGIGKWKAQVPVTVLAEPAPWGVLAVTSRPPWAEIFRNDVDTERKTPWIFARVPPGTHKISVELSGWVAQPKQVYLAAGDVRHLHFWLLPPGLTGKIAVQSEPPRAAVLLDGRATGVLTPGVLDPVGVGQHAVTLLLKGYQKWSGAVDVQPGATAEVSVTLVPIGAGA